LPHVRRVESAAVIEHLEAEPATVVGKMNHNPTRMRVLLNVVQRLLRYSEDHQLLLGIQPQTIAFATRAIRILVRPARSESSQSSAGTSSRSSSTDGRRARHNRRISSMQRCSAASTSSSPARAGTDRPGTPNLSFTKGQTISSMVIVTVGTDGKLTFYNSAGTVDVIADLTGYFTG
jgi:hypothetical protein